MTTARQILDMIEKVDPQDSEALDEICLRFWAWYYKLKGHNKPRSILKNPMGNVDLINTRDQLVATIPREAFWVAYSRDVLKAVRPEGWLFVVMPGTLDDLHLGGAKAMATRYENYNPLETLHLPTEEVAELHAIVQAKAYDRGEEV